MDAAQVVRAQQGDPDAFACLATALAVRFHGVAHGILRDAELARDATQHALLRVWSDLPALRDPDRFEAWAYRILVRICHAENRRARRWMPTLVLTDTDEPRVADGVDVVADRDQLERGFRRLSVDHRAIVVLHHYAGMTLDEVAATLTLPVGTVRSRHHRAMAGLRAALEADARTPERARHPGRTAGVVGARHDPA